jgi:hypothetical protein
MLASEVFFLKLKLFIPTGIAGGLITLKLQKMAIFAKICKNRQIVKALNFKGFEHYFFNILHTTSMCVVLDGKNFFCRADLNGKNTRFYAYFRIFLHR